jgi:hypothetical protein
LNTNLDEKTIALLDRERSVRRDLNGNKTLLVSVGEILVSFLPRYLETTWRINFFEHRKEHTVVDLQPERDEKGRRIKLALSFLRGEPRVNGLFRYEEETRTWSLIFGTDPAARGKRVKRSVGLTSEDIPSLLVVLLFIPLFVLALSAPCRALMLLLHEALHQLPAGMAITYPIQGFFGIVLQPGHLDMLGGACGAILGFLAAFNVGFWQLRIARQVKNIATATARSAAVGLAEVRGIARGRKTILHFSSGDTAESTTQALTPFDLDDGTGTIRVDPEGAVMRSFWSLQFLQRMGGSVVLTKWVTQRAYGRKEVRELKDGDPVYVLGSVEQDPEAASDAKDSGRLVVRRSRRQVPMPFLYRLLKAGRSPEKFTSLDVFFLSDTPEQRAYDWIMADLRKTTTVAAVWIGLSSWLLWQGGRAIKAW